MRQCFIAFVFLISLVSATNELSSGIQKNPSCSVNQFECDDGVCVGVEKLCDGAKDCDDDTDERNCAVRSKRSLEFWSQLGKNWWCTYMDDCIEERVDTKENAESLTSRCNVPPHPSNGRYEAVGANKEYGSPGDSFPYISLNITCDPGYEIQGKATNCVNGIWTDELPRCVASKRCVMPPAPRFGKYEGWVKKNEWSAQDYSYILLKITCDPGYEIQGINSTKCFEGKWSDPLPICVASTLTSATPATDLCVLPQHPVNGRYNLLRRTDFEPGQAFESVVMNVTCDPGFGPIDNTDVFCVKGMWSDPLPQCTRYCKLVNHPSIEYKCRVAGRRSMRGTRDCNEYEPHGTVVIPECRKPMYFFPGRLPYMHCIDGSWNHMPICKPECGRITPSAEQLIINGTRAHRGELPWHAGIYSKQYTPYKQICGGSLVSNKIVISAAHCFWDSMKMHPASDYAVAVGKLYRPWNNPVDEDAQKSNVSDIKSPYRFRGDARNLEGDIAILVLTSSIEFRTYVRPICIDFDLDSNKPLLKGKMGKIAGWGYTSPHGNPSSVLKTVAMPFIPLPECELRVPQMYLEYLTPDKICAGYTTGTALCKGDSGGGLAFPEWDGGVVRYYLRGVVSASPTDQNLCNAYAITGFTNITAHKDFIEEYL